MSKIHQNNSGYPMGWKSFIVPANYVYGTISGFDFVAVPIADRKFRKVPIVEVCKKMHKISKAKKDYPAISSAIIDAILDCQTVKLLSWNYMADFKKAVKADAIAREHTAEVRNHKAIVSAHANRVSAGKKAAHRTKAFRPNDNYFTAEYNRASVVIYGRSVEMNGRKRKCTGKTAEYMDGSGLGTVRGDMRPLAPVFPVPSGKKAR